MEINMDINMDIKLLDSRINHKELETKWQGIWEKTQCFHSVPDDRKKFSMVIPPPNVTGVLHMGHALNNTFQDVIARAKRAQGYNVCWVPGTDHAGIATQVKVQKELESKGIKVSELTKEQFIEHIYEWKKQSGSTIINQLKKLGCSCDWTRECFTMDDKFSLKVKEIFIKLYEDKLVYQSDYLINWDPILQTAIADDEVESKPVKSKLYYIKYFKENTSNSDPEYIVVATSRPETLFGDVAIGFGENDSRYSSIGSQYKIPIINKPINLIPDTNVDKDFGTGLVKITPAHDKFDFEFGKTHELKPIQVIDKQGKLFGTNTKYDGLNIYQARKQLVKELEELGHIEKIVEYDSVQKVCYRSGAQIEPQITTQWFVDMKLLGQMALETIENNEIKLYPQNQTNKFYSWINEIRPWCISRQLIWGHQIPIFNCVNSCCSNQIACTNNPEICSKCSSSMVQETDVLDTWFSSWLWSFGVFEPDELDYYFPTDILITGSDILFFWVARMIIAGYEYTGKKPFTNVYLTGLVRDKQRRKMSKSLGNSPDPLDLIDKFGADGVRVGLLLSASAGNDIMFDEDLCNQGKAFTNKIWNAFKLIKGWEVSDAISQPESSKVAIEWYEAKLQQTLLDIEDNFEKYRISDALMGIYKLVWDDFCSWFLEMIKPGYQQPIDSLTLAKAIEMLENNLKLLHPFMPFLTEEIWQLLTERTKEEALIVSTWPTMKPFNASLITDFDNIIEVISGIRTIRKDKNIPFKDAIELKVVNNDKSSTYFDAVVSKLGNIATLDYVSDKVDGALSFRVKSNEYCIPITGNINVEEEIAKLTEELNYIKGFLKSVQGKLSNEKFVAGAPEKVIEMERKKEADALAKIATIEQSLAGLK